MPYRMREVAAVYTSVVPKGEKHASNNNNAPTVVKPSSKVSPTSGPLSPAKLKCCQSCARLERGTAAINASCSMNYNTKPIATAPRIASGLLSKEGEVYSRLATASEGTPNLIRLAYLLHSARSLTP